MATIPSALSVHHFISSVGADVGFASIIGLAILVLLYFAQARETANLREQAYESAQRVAQLEARLAAMSRRQTAVAAPPAVAAQPALAARPAAVAAARVPAPAPALVGAVAGAPGPPAGVAAPALSAATKLIPTTPIGSESPVDERAPRPVDLTALAGPPPATVAAGANAAAGAAAAAAGATAAGATAAGGNGVAKDGVGAAPTPIAAPPPARVGLPPPPGRGTRQAEGGRRRGSAPPRFSEPPPRSRRGVRIALGLVAVLVIAGGVLALIHFTSSNGNPASTKASVTSNAALSSHRKLAGSVAPSSVTVAVLNGTATSGLAERIATRLTSAGYKKGMVGNASDQTRTATVVAYTRGHKEAALAVAKTLKLGPASVQPIDPNTQAVACPGGTTCADKVVVTVGTDLAA